ncbi:34-kDa subunit of RNA polymerase III (C) [Agyrium rufum]|nr:34-kDa subunit of RNA polymerase III (C) [Agyrium rufum]
MASQAAVPTASQAEISNALYASCASRPANSIFDQKDLLSLGVIPDSDVKFLQACISRLTAKNLFKLMKRDNGQICWKVVKKEDAVKYKNFSVEEALVYSYIESSAREGIWTRTLRSRTNLHPTTMNRCLKALENKSMIRAIQSAKFPTRKTYILFNLQPSEDITGGPFYTDGKLDEVLIQYLQENVEKYIRGRSWRDRGGGGAGAAAGGIRVDATKPNGGLAGVATDHRAADAAYFNAGEHDVRGRDIPMPPGFKGYPTIPEITRAINSFNLVSLAIKEAEMKQLLDILCWDGRVMKVMGGKGYKAVRAAGSHSEYDIENGLTQAPCGRCPVFDLCEEDGPVNARDCVYFQEWLKQGLTKAES